MDSPPSIELRLFSLDGQPLAAPCEWMPALIEVCLPAEARKHVRLSIQGRSAVLRLEEWFGYDRLLADWNRAGPGNYRVRLELGAVAHEVVWRVVPAKIPPESYAALIDDLEAHLPVAIAMGLAQTGGLAGLDFVEPRASTLAEELTRLRRAIDGNPGSTPGLEAVLLLLAKSHHRVLTSETHWVPRHRVRRPVAAALAYALSRPGNLDADGTVLSALDSRIESTVDVYENRLIKLFGHQISLRLKRLIIALEARDQSGALAAARGLQLRLDRALREAAFLEQVQLPTHFSARPSMVFLKVPAYRAALQGYLELHRGLAVILHDEALETPLENLPRLYELWGTLQVIQAVLRFGATRNLKAEYQRLVRINADDLYVRVLPDGEPALSLTDPATGTRIVFRPQPAYSRSGRLRSVSFAQKPDLALEIERPDGKLQVIVLDPKYKLESDMSGDEGCRITPKKEDIDKMHAYRDAIRTAAGESCVIYAAILYPGPSFEYGSVGAISALPGQLSISAALEPILASAFSP
jgi:hypothetical protein